MLFNSIEFAVFLPVVFLIYWFVVGSRLKVQNFMLLAASYIFYGWWDWRFLSLIAFSSFLDYFVGIGFSRTEDPLKRKLLLLTSLLVNLGFLGFFKYYNFFAENFADAFTLMGSHIEVSRLNIILPVGISFYTFQTLSYSIDVYRKKLEPTKDLLSFLAFVSFFPQLVAGPIERASNLLPQFSVKRTFNYTQAVDGMRQILWGLFKKIVIADNCAEYVNMIFNNYDQYHGSTLLMGTVFFAFQIYGDFSGYSDIAIGTSRLFGFNLMKNFAFPYFSRDIAEFWRRWHISLSTWFRDYLYIPLGGSRGSTASKIRNTFIIFLVSGFWHGANWTFIAWGALHAIYFLPLLLFNRNRANLEVVAKGNFLPGLRESASILGTFALTCLAWIFFRADNLSMAFEYLGSILSSSLFNSFQTNGVKLVPLLIAFTLIEWMGRSGEYALEKTAIRIKQPYRWVTYYAVVILILMYAGKQQEFIYFQF